jgi:4a-hydroxytetrahydrobiopterin dehydratase
MSELSSQHCVPCRGGMPPLQPEEYAPLYAQLGEGWEVYDGHHLYKRYAFPDFAQALAFVNRVGAIAEAEGHHPDVLLAWGKVELTIWTHKIGGLSLSDFVLAAKADEALAG